MTPKAGFDAALARASHLLRLYELICDIRKYNVRKDWAKAFKKVMRWPDSEAIVRVDGKDKESLLVLRGSVGIDRTHFAHDYLSELLRSAVVAAVSALDRYLHDLIVKHSWKLLANKEEDIPKHLRNLTLTVHDARKAVEHLRRNPTARPGNLIKQAIQETLHRQYTFQSPDAVLKATQMLGIENFWQQVAKRMPGSPPPQEVQQTLREITRRRNQVVHEADLVRTQKAQPSLRDITHAEAERWVLWMRAFGDAIQGVVDATVA